MDIPIQMRSIELLIKILKRDLTGVPSYGYTLQKPPMPAETPARGRMFKSAPEMQGVPCAALERFLRALDDEGQKLGVHGVMVLRHGAVICEAYWAPYRAQVPHMLYSMSKTVTGMAIGILVDEGYLSLDETLVSIFPELVLKQQFPFFPQNHIRQMTVRHLLTMSTGCRFNEIGSMLDGDWARMFMESVPKFEPGSAFEYNSLNSYMLSAIVARRTGMGLSDYLRPRLFEPLGIAQYAWEKCPMGIEKGGWGLSLTLEDTAKLGQLYLNGGEWNGRRIISEDWIRASTKIQTAIPGSECKNGYGYQVWIGKKDGVYQFNGAFGQHVVVLPSFDAVVAIFSGSSQLFADNSILERIYECFAQSSDLPIKADKGSASSLSGYIASLKVKPRLKEDGLCACPQAFARMADALDQREYRLERSIAGLFPFTLQAMHGNYTMGVDMLSFHKVEGGLAVTFYEFSERNTLVIKNDGSFATVTVAMRGERHLVSTRALWSEDGKRLVIIASFIETPDTRIITLAFNDDGSLSATFDEMPTIAAASSMLFRLIGLSRRSYFRKLIHALRSENLMPAMKNFAIQTPRGFPVTQNDVL